MVRQSGALRRASIVVGLLAVAGLASAACTTSGAPSAASGGAPGGATGATWSSSSSPGSRATRSSSSAGSTSKSAKGSKKSKGSSGSKKKKKPGLPSLSKLAQDADAASGTTFMVTYRASDGSPPLVYAQMGPKSSFVNGTTGYYSDGVSNLVCDSTTGSAVCHPDSHPLGGILSLVRPANVAAAIREASAHSSTVSRTSQSGGGECLAYSLQGQAVKYCLNSHGIVTFVGMPDGSFKMRTYTKDVADKDVSAP